MSVETVKAETERKRGSLLYRLMRYRLVVPVVRGRGDPRRTARGVAIGFGLAMMPTVGIQMALVALVWAVLRWFAPNWRFNVVVALAWTWITNIFTMVPIYYAFLVTGNLMLLRDDPFGGFDAFSERLTSLLSANAGFLESFWIYTVAIFSEWGLPMALGSLPWAVASAWIGYVWCLKFLEGIRKAQQRRIEAKRRKKASTI